MMRNPRECCEHSGGVAELKIEEFDMQQRTCQVCSTVLAGRQRLYCSRSCSIKATTMRRDPEYFRTYRQQHQADISVSRRARRSMRTCVTCGTQWPTGRADAKYCSTICRVLGQGMAPVEPWPRVTPHTQECPACLQEFSTTRTDQVYCTQRCAERAREARRAGLDVWVPAPRRCDWCDTEFMPTSRQVIRCSSACKRRQLRANRRAREVGAPGTYTWAEVMKVFIQLGRTCAYCRQPVASGRLEPDHVVPLSRGGSNSITNVLPSCRDCNADKRDLMLDEWAEDRVRRGLDAISIDLDAVGYRHLTSLTCLVPA